MWYNDFRPKEELTPNKYALIFHEESLKLSEADKKRALTNTVNLKKGINKEVPRKEVDTNILLASWNIKEFGHLNERLPESYLYIAEIISAFDIIALQEIKSSLFDLDLVMRLLGSNYKYVITDITEGRAGNKERFGIIYDTRRVTHSGLSGELVIAPEDSLDNSYFKQLKRTPAITGFESGWKKFSIVNLHLQPGNSLAHRAKRKQEVKYLLNTIMDKKDGNRLWNDNLIILGDTNLYKNNTDIVDLFTQRDFKECESLKGKATTPSGTKSYDRIFLNVDKYFKLKTNRRMLENGGVFNPFKYVFRKEDEMDYRKKMLRHKDDPTTLDSPEAFQRYFNRYWKVGQLSDHLPIWVEIEADSSIDFLESKRNKIKVD